MNVDYTIDLSRSFPSEILNFDKGFLDLHRPAHPVLGAACVFDPESYSIINGFPNDLYGWGGDDSAIYNRIIEKNIPIFCPENLYNSGFIIETNNWNVTDTSNNDRNSNLAHNRHDIDTNGITTCKYIVNNYYNQHNIHHFLLDLCKS